MLPYEMKMNIVSGMPQESISAAQRMGWGISERALALGSEKYQAPVQSALFSSPTQPSGIAAFPTAPVPIESCESRENGCAIDVRSGAALATNASVANCDVGRNFQGSAPTNHKVMGWNDYSEKYVGEERDGFEQTALRPAAGYRIQPAQPQNNVTQANLSTLGPQMARWVPETLQTRVELKPKDQAPEADFAQDYYSEEEAKKYDKSNRNQESLAWTTKEARSGITNFALRNGGTSPVTSQTRFTGVPGTFLQKPQETLTPAYQLDAREKPLRSEVESELHKYKGPLSTYGVVRTSLPVSTEAAMMATRPSLPASSPDQPPYHFVPAPAPAPAPVPTHFEDDFTCASVNIVTNQGAGKLFSSTLHWLGQLFQCTYYRSWKGLFEDLNDGLPLKTALTTNYRIVYILLAILLFVLVAAIIVAIVTPSSKSATTVVRQPAAAAAPIVVNSEDQNANTFQEGELKQELLDQQREINSLESSVGNGRALGQGSNPTVYGS